jgi:acyl-coenzyme A synthetase/AMP-(fatty) acid ligase
LAGTATLRKLIATTGRNRWILHCNDYWYFLLAYTALLQCKKDVLLTANISPVYIAEIAAEFPAGTAFITDEEDALGLLDCSFFVPEIVDAAEMDADKSFPFINAAETVIIMYTSGTTGQPKAVVQRLTEFENDNAFILSKWGEEFIKRKVCSTVSPHHIYGLLFSVMLPFTAGVPFRRERIVYSETFRQLTDDSYLIVTVPALLKRAVEEAASPAADFSGKKDPGGSGSYGLRSPWIFSSGGAVLPETAAAVEQIFGFWPLEVYGSTETSGIAWRQSKDGSEWIPFDNARIWKNSGGCLVIKSPYIRDEAGFTTGDLAEILPDGRFFLLGRADSIVKIEEKRVSLPEVENRIMQSGLVLDTAVIAQEDKRQYLSAAVVLNEKGKTRFENCEKNQINTFFRRHLQQFFENLLIPKRWRYLEALPRNPQGKLLRQELEDLFRRKFSVFPDSSRRIVSLPHDITGVVVEQTERTAVIKFTVPESYPCFDGHFSGFKLLPAVAQFELVCACAEQMFGAGAGFSVSGARRLKFTTIISPGTELCLLLQFEKSEENAGQTLKGSPAVLRFTLKSPAGDTSYSAGTVNCEIAGRES